MFTNKIYLKSRERAAENTVKLVFDKPINFNFIAGQYVMLGVKKGDNTLTNPMTIASAPYQEELEFIMRITDSDFKKVVVNMKLGDEAYIGNALGTLILGDQSESVVLLAGGIGITPFLSILKQAANDKSRQSFVLIYSNQTEEDIVSHEEVKNYNLQNYKILLTLTKESGNSWLGGRGRIDIATLVKCLPQLLDYTYYIVGTSSFVEGMVSLLEEANISNNQIKRESFLGYKNA